jgi:hypothetical protein
MSERPGVAPKKAVPFAPEPNGEPVENYGQAIVAMLNDAAHMAQETCKRATETAEILAHKVRASEDRIRELQAELRQYQARASQAEKWLLRVHQEITQNFFDAKEGRSGTAARRQ